LKIEGNAGFTLLTVPQGLSVNKLKQFAPQLFKPISLEIQDRFGNIETTETKVVLISNALLHGYSYSIGMIHQKLLEKIGCEMVDVVTMLALLVITHISSEEEPPIRLLHSDQTYVYACCKERGSRGWDVIVGDFTLDGLQILNSNRGFVNGVVAMRRV
jgi:hypothetical protein